MFSRRVSAPCHRPAIAVIVVAGRDPLPQPHTGTALYTWDSDGLGQSAIIRNNPQNWRSNQSSEISPRTLIHVNLVSSGAGIHLVIEAKVKATRSTYVCAALVLQMKAEESIAAPLAYLHVFPRPVSSSIVQVS
jgi:hypothetical protein